ncbi:3',5'-cyclic-nucleotide phosphodiesterase [Ascochyta rabiei]|uniref:3',5'-cyclic-AMP phosphodiesterase n=1 Tax=Didymella rabiei TaxID=5454 RepID=A0A163D2E1_DIDRA|nr:3',5'-cyclic-nucleotide phosphodiesterase [Ascochyta rabiei]KZM22859.1 3',5'-cyclic-AMP phosphodiesterase [Ascochyta rabiei]UPX16393.1 3',5'-cyclic-nucleotide phosphodiesterase [Ascochyta rabiei]
MKDSDGHREVRRSSSHSYEPAIQVICLGAGGGPTEDNVTGFLVRSTATKWSKNSVLAVDAGSHLAAITRILEQHFPLVSEPLSQSPSKVDSIHDDGVQINDNGTSPTTEHIPTDDDDDSGIETPVSEDGMPPEIITLLDGVFAGLPFPNASARANALHVVREHISTYLITHPHLDHLSGFVINTAAFHNTSRPKRLAALPSTVHAIKTHIFNNIIWPNLTDEDGGVGLVSFQRLAEGGNIALGQGRGRGYIEVCDGLGVKGFKVSHGHCMRGPGHVHRGSNAGLQETPGLQHTVAALHQGEIREGRSHSISMPVPHSQPGTPGTGPFGGDHDRRSSHVAANTTIPADHCVIDSSAFFIRTESTLTTPTKEILIFGDVEPDSLSLSPRTAHIWSEAAPKIASGILTGIFIECSYTNAQADAVLFGHLAPRHLLAELHNLADMVREARREHEQAREAARQGRKRKRASQNLLLDGPVKSRTWHPGIKNFDPSLFSIRPPSQTDDDLTDCAPSSGPTGTHTPNPHDAHYATPSLPQKPYVSHSSAAAALNLNNVSAGHNRALLSTAFEAPLKGLKVVVIHVKDPCDDGPLVGDTILRQLQEGEMKMNGDGMGLGCSFEISKSGDAYWF